MKQFHRYILCIMILDTNWWREKGYSILTVFEQSGEFSSVFNRSKKAHLMNVNADGMCSEMMARKSKMYIVQVQIMNGHAANIHLLSLKRFCEHMVIFNCNSIEIFESQAGKKRNQLAFTIFSDYIFNQYFI